VNPLQSVFGALICRVESEARHRRGRARSRPLAEPLEGRALLSRVAIVETAGLGPPAGVGAPSVIVSTQAPSATLRSRANPAGASADAASSGPVLLAAFGRDWGGGELVTGIDTGSQTSDKFEARGQVNVELDGLSPADHLGDPEPPGGVGGT
jgi:hypothetical protein